MIADKIIKSDAIYTASSKGLISGGIAIKDNKIIRVGNDSDLAPLTGSDTLIFDYKDKLVMPGFIDAHMHFFEGSFVLSPYMLMDIFASESEIHAAQMVKAFAEAHPDFDRIAGMGWNPTIWEDSSLPTKESLDAVVDDRPVYLFSADAHTLWLNTKAIEECGITKNTKVQLGRIGLGQDGEPNGLLFEIEAAAIAKEHAIVLPAHLQKQLISEFILGCAANGITSAADMSASPIHEKSFKNYEITSELEKNGELKMRLHLFPSLGTDTDLSNIEILKNKYNSDKLRIAGLKQFMDGVSSTYTASLIEPYSDIPDTSGKCNYPYKIYRDAIINANNNGYGVRLHAIGDKAVKTALDLFEESACKRSDVKNTIEHIESIDPSDISRFKKHNVTACMQPIHLILDKNEKIQRIGKERCKWEWPVKSIKDSGAVVAFGTDFPVADINPFKNIYAAVTRKDEKGEAVGINPEECISLNDAIDAYTIGSARAVNMEKMIGSIESGKLADIIIVDRNLFSCQAEEIAEATVKATFFDGEIVFKNNG